MRSEKPGTDRLHHSRAKLCKYSVPTAGVIHKRKTNELAQAVSVKTYVQDVHEFSIC
jgi:hypothetical protein